MNKEGGKGNFTLRSYCVLPGIKFAPKWLIYKTIGDCIHNLQSPSSPLKNPCIFLYCVILGKWVRCKKILCKKKIVVSAILIPSALPQSVVHPAHCSGFSRRVFRTTSFARTCSVHPGHTKEIHPIWACLVMVCV